MHNNQTPKIDFRKVRDFGQLFTEVFRFLKYNFKTIFLCVLLIPGPIFLIAGAFYGYLQSLGTNPSNVMGVGIFRDPMSAFTQIMSAMLPYFILVILGSLAASATINRYFILYQERDANNNITVGDILKHVPGDMWRLFYNGLLLMFIVFLIMIPVAFIAMIPLIGFLAIVIALLLAGPQLRYAITSGFYIVLRDKILITKAVSKAWKYMGGNFWWTWLIVVCASLIVGIMGAVFSIPMAIMGMANTFSRISHDVATSNNSVLYVVLGIFAIFGPQLLAPIATLFSVLTYHSYEEGSEGEALKEKINAIDKE